MKALRSLILPAMFTLAASSALAADDPAFGLWLVEAKTAIVEIAPCGDKACGKIVWLEEPNDANGAPKVDTQNPDEGNRSNPICGLAMLGNFAQDSEGEWESGYIYDASDGSTYDAKMAVQEGGTLEVRGFIGVSLFGKSQTWSRVEDARGGC